MTTQPQAILDAGERRRLELLVSVFPLVVINAMPGGGGATLLRRWANQPDTPEIRLLIEADKVSATGTQILDLVARVIAAESPGEPRSDRIPATAGDLPGLLATIRRPVVIGVTRADFLGADTFARLLTLLTPRDLAQLVVAGFDCHAFETAAVKARVPFRMITDEDLALTREEVGALLQQASLPSDAETSGLVLRRTRGMPGVVRVALDRALDSDDPAAELTLAPGDLGAFLFVRGVEQWPSELAAFMRDMVYVPRFTMAQANAISGQAGARTFVDRMCGMQLGAIAVDPAVRQQVFSWFEPARLGALEYLRQGETEVERTQRLRRILLAAREELDSMLYIATLVALGRLSDAELYLTDWLWDSLPNGFSPVWAPVVALAPRDCEEFPHLAVLRSRVEPRAPLTRAIERLVARLGSRAVAAVRASLAGTDPDGRAALRDAALGIEFMRVCRHLDGLPRLVAEARDAAQLVRSSAVGAGAASAISGLLLIADALLRVGSAAAAAEFGGYALDVLDDSGSLADPWGERRGFAARVVLASDRQRGIVDSVQAESRLAGAGLRWRDGDFLAQTLAQMWADMDRGDLDAAERASAYALRRLTRPESWPTLWYAHLWLLGVRHRHDRALLARDRYVAACQQVGIEVGAVDMTATALREAGDLIGGPLAAPDLVPAAWPATEGTASKDVEAFSPRRQSAKLLLDAVQAVRQERRRDARELLTRAITLTLPRALFPAILASTTRDEVRELAAIIADHPFASALRLDLAMMIAHHSSGEVDLSDREAEVLALLRQGSTNKQIAAELFVTINTVKFHRSNLMRKLGSSTRQQLLESAERLGL